MDWLRTAFERLKAFFSQTRLDYELDEELETHLSLVIEENRQRGLPEKEAKEAALREFGPVTQMREHYRLQRGLPFLETIVRDIQFGKRQILRTPGFAIVAIITLALGIGANTAVFTLTHALLLITLPVRDPGELVRLAMDLSATQPEGKDAPLNLPIIEEIQRRSHSFHDFFSWCVYDFPFKDGDHTGGIHGAIVSGNTFQALGVQPAAGRLLTPADDQQGGGPDGMAAVISYRVWMERYHSDPTIIGHHVIVTDHPATIVGVAPAGFEGVIVAEHPDIYLPLEFDAVLYGQEAKHSGGRLWLECFARLNLGVGLNQAHAEMKTLFLPILKSTLPPALQHLPMIEKARLDINPARTGWSKLRAQYTQPLLLLQIMVGAVLLICCANLSGLFLARALARRQEFAIRGALGAGRLRLMRQLFIECLMLALPGALLGIWLAWAVGPWIVHMLGNREAEDAISMRPDLVVLSVSIACATVCALLFGIAPAWIASRTSIDSGLRVSNRRVSADGATLRNLFIPIQIALALVLVVVAALLGTTISHLVTESSGYRTDHVYFALTDFLRIPQKGDAMVNLYWRMAERMEQSPGVEQANVAAVTPLSGSRYANDFVAADQAAHARPIEAVENIVSARYFATLGIPLLSGRDLVNNSSDRSSCILSHAAAQLYFHGTSALGKTLRKRIQNVRKSIDTYEDCQVVGIVQDSKYDSLRETSQPIVYLPLHADEESTNAGATAYFMMRARSLDAARSAYLATLHEMAPTSPEIPPFEFNQTFQASIARERLLSVLSGFFALLGLLLSAIGIYGLVAWQVARRTTEIGLRMAFGASRARVFVFVMQQVIVLLTVGVLAGGIAAIFAARSVRAFLFEVQPGNPAVFALSALALVLVALLAAALPARRAVSIDPMQALKSE